MTGVSKELHEKALQAAGKTFFANWRAGAPESVAAQMAIGDYLRTAGLTVVPVRPSGRIVHGSGIGISDGSDWTETNDERYMRIISDFESPFKESKDV